MRARADKTVRARGRDYGSWQGSRPKIGGTSVAPSEAVHILHPPPVPSCADPRLAFHILRRLQQARALWGPRAALPLASFGTMSRHPLRVLRAIAALEREGVVAIRRDTRTVSLVVRA